MQRKRERTWVLPIKNNITTRSFTQSKKYWNNTTCSTINNLDFHRFHKRNRKVEWVWKIYKITSCFLWLAPIMWAPSTSTINLLDLNDKLNMLSKHVQHLHQAQLHTHKMLQGHDSKVCKEKNPTNFLKVYIKYRR